MKRKNEKKVKGLEIPLYAAISALNRNVALSIGVVMLVAPSVWNDASRNNMTFRYS